MEIDERRRRMVLLSRLARGAALTLAVCLPLLGLASWAFASERDLVLAAGLGDRTVSLEVAERIGAAVLSILPVLALGWALVRLASTLQMFGAGQPFRPEAAAGLRDFGFGVLACAVLKPVVATALSVLLTWYGPGPKSLAISITSDTLLLLLLGVVMTLLGWAHGEAALLAEDNAQIV